MRKKSLPFHPCAARGIAWASSVGLALAVAYGGEIKELHEKWVRPKAMDQSKQLARFESLDAPKHGVSEIGLERAPGYGKFPTYWVTLKADGTFRYEGVENVAHLGKHTGRVTPWEFNHLATLVVESGYADLDSTYDVSIADLPVAYTTAVIQGKRKVVRNTGDLGPIKLWAIQQAIDAILIRAEWDGEITSPTSEKGHSPRKP